MNLTDACIRKPVFAWMIMAAAILFGAVASQEIGISQFPDVDFPTISVSFTWEGAAPEVMEHDVVDPVEESLAQVEGIRTLSSSSRRGGASISVEVDLARDVDLAMQDVQARVSQVLGRLPRELDPPTYSKNNPEDSPILWLGVSGPFPPQVLADFVRYRLKERVQTVPGVGEIMLGGFLERNLRVWVDAALLDEKGLTVTDVVEALRRQHVEMPAGRLEAGGREINVRVLGEALDLEAFRMLVVREEGGAPVRLQDVAIVEDGFEDPRRVARINGVPGQGVGVKKQRGANAVAVARGVRAVLDELRPTLPSGMELGVNFDGTKPIEDSVREVTFGLILSVVLTALVCKLFLGSLRSTLNVVMAIPMSLMGTVAVIYFLGYTFNTFTVLALSLAVGIVVDDAVMVMENIFRHAEAGKPRAEAAREGTKEIAFAALAATLAVVAIFIPVIFMKGIVGKYLLQFGVTLSVAVMLSYLEAITLAPARCSQFMEVSRDAGKTRWMDRAFAAAAAAYGRLLQGVLRHPLPILAATLLLFAGSVALALRLPRQFVPSQDMGRMFWRVQTAVGSDIGETDRLFRKAEAIVNGQPEVERCYAVIGGFGGTGINSGIMFVTLVPREQRKASQLEMETRLRGQLNAIPGIRAFNQDLSQSGFTAQRGFPVEFSIRGSDWDSLLAANGRVMKTLKESGAVVDLQTDYQIGIPELRVVPDRARAADLGVSVEDVASTINALVGGVRVGKYNTGGRRFDVRLRLLSPQRSRPEDLERLHVRGRGGERVPLSALVTSEERPALQAITRRDRERSIQITANVAPGRSQEEALRQVEGLRTALPEGIRLHLSGASATYRESMWSLWIAWILGIAVAYMILASQFNSLVHPITVLTILLPSATGAIVALWAAGHSINIFSIIGGLLLMGIVKKNSIILVDYANQLRREGAGAAEAMARAGPVRLRPILMTSISTLAAAVPPALAWGPGGEIRAPMAVAVLGGLALSTALSLFVVPAFYVVVSRSVNEGDPPSALR